MVDPVVYHGNRSAAQDKLNTVFVPRLTSLMSWDFKEGNILDYGCGPGSTGFEMILPFVESTKSQMYSVDISPKMVEYAQKIFPHPRIHYKSGHFPDNFPFDDIKFDKVFSINVFHYLRDIESTLKSIVSVLKPGGQLGFTSSTINSIVVNHLCHFMDSPTWGQYMEGCEEHIPVWSEYGDMSPETFFREILIEKTGLKEVHFEITKISIPGRVEQGVDTLFSLNPCIQNVPKNLHDELREEYRQFITSSLGVPLETEEVLLPMEYMYAVLEKP